MIIERLLPECLIDEAENGKIALEKIKQNKYDLVILDVNMPGTDSYELVSDILAFSHLNILMFSMNSEEIYAKRFLKIGAMGYVRKDAPEEEIGAAITTTLNNRRYLSPGLIESLLVDMRNNDSENPFEKLSAREFEIIQHLVRGDSPREICKKLSLHASTVGTHKARIFEKLNCNNIIELNILAKQHHIID